MKYSAQRYIKEKAKRLLWTVVSLFCRPLDRSETRGLSQLEQLFDVDQFEFKILSINGIKTKLPVDVVYPDTRVFRLQLKPQLKLQHSSAQSLRILPSGGICSGNKILCTGFEGQQAFNILGYLQSFVKRKQTISGSIICSWPQQFLTYGDFVLQLLPELCLIKSILPQEEWLRTSFIFHQPPRFLVNYLKLLGCNESQIIDSSDCCFDVAAPAQVYFREKDKMWFLCAPVELLQISRNYLMPEQVNPKTSASQTSASQTSAILFVERLGGYRSALGLDDSMRVKLSELGVTFFDPTGTSIETQIAAFSSAKMVIGVHGAGIANLLWCQPGTKVIEIFHPQFAPWCYAILANQLKMDYYSLGRDPGSMDVTFREADVVVDWGHLIDLIQRLKEGIVQG